MIRTEEKIIDEEGKEIDERWSKLPSEYQQAKKISIRGNLHHCSGASQTLGHRTRVPDISQFLNNYRFECFLQTCPTNADCP